MEANKKEWEKFKSQCEKIELDSFFFSNCKTRVLYFAVHPHKGEILVELFNDYTFRIFVVDFKP